MNKKSIFLFSALLVLISACNLPSIGGVVQGVVYADLNGDGVLSDAEEAGPKVDGATVTLTDCGPTQTQLTDANGAFRFENLVEGTCHVTVTKGGWEFTGSYPDLGYPFPVASDPDLPSSFSLYMHPVMDFIPTETPTPAPGIPPAPSVAPATPTSSAPMVTPASVDVNCRFGPGTGYLATGSLRVGEVVPIQATIADRSWWRIADPRNPGVSCWVNASVTNATGDLALVPVVDPPGGLVTGVTIDPLGDVMAACDGPTAYNPYGYITTNGPATVTYRWEIWRDGSLFHGGANETIVFTEATTQTINPGADHGGCGSYVVKLIVTSPNAMSAEEPFTISGSMVTGVTIDPIANVSASCSGPTAYNPRGTITTNGPATVTYRWEIWKDGSYYHGTSDEMLVFSSATTQVINPGADRGGCGSYVVRLIVTSPNAMSAEEPFTISAP